MTEPNRKSVQPRSPYICLVGSTDFSILQGFEAKGFYHGYLHKHEMFFFSDLHPRIRGDNRAEPKC